MATQACGPEDSSQYFVKLTVKRLVNFHDLGLLRNT